MGTRTTHPPTHVRGGDPITRALSAVAAAVILTGALWYAVWPPRSEAGYRHQAEQTVATLQSHVATAQLWGRELDRDHTFLTTAQVGLGELESDATGTVGQFSAYQPPGGLEPLRKDVTSLGGRVVTDLGEIRVAARDGNVALVIEKAAALDEVLRRIKHLERRIAQ